jgi:hypothetical protein
MRVHTNRMMWQMVLWTALDAGLLALPCQAGDWPQWCGNDARNAVSEETHLPARFVPNPTQSPAIDEPPPPVEPTHDPTLALCCRMRRG